MSAIKTIPRTGRDNGALNTFRTQMTLGNAKESAAPNDSDVLLQEVEFLRNEIARQNAAKRAIDLALMAERRAGQGARDRISRIEATISMQVGSALVDASRSPAAALRLPARLVDLYRATREMKRRRRLAAQPGKNSAPLEPAVSPTGLHETVAGGDTRVIVAKPRGRSLPFAVLPGTLAEKTSMNAATPPALATQAVGIDPRHPATAGHAFEFFERGRASEAAHVLDAMETAGVVLDAAEAGQAEKIRAHARLASDLGAFPAITGLALHPPSGRIVYLSQDFAYPQPGESAARVSRRAGLAGSLGWDVLVLGGGSDPAGNAGSAPSRPLAPFPGSIDLVDRFIPRAASHLAGEIRVAGGGIVHADAHGVQALIAALAAEQAGCPFVLDLRELVDLSLPFMGVRADSEVFRTSLYLTIVAAQRARRCLVGTRIMFEALSGGGVDPGKIETVPDVFEQDVPVLARDPALAGALGLADAEVFGFVGSLHELSGMDTLVHVLARLRDTHPRLRLLLAGRGPAAGHLRDALSRLRLTDRAVILENANPAQMRGCQALIDVAALPVAATLETALLSPYDLLNAMVHGRAVVASWTHNAIEFVKSGRSGLLRDASDVEAFALAVSALLNDPARRNSLGAAARADAAALTGRDRIGRQLDSGYRSLFMEPVP